MSPAFATVLCFVILPLLVFLPFLWLSDWLDRRDRIPEDVWATYQALKAQRILAEICRDRFGWFVVAGGSRLVVFTEAPVVRGWSQGRWLVYAQTTGEILFHGRWQEPWVRYPKPLERAGWFSLREM